MATYYLKYRPQNLEQLDLEHVRESLTKVVSSDDIPHAFLFHGPKGTGKTSAARILAKVLNCTNRKGKSTKPCNRCSQCKSITDGTNIDVIELDAASHRGIDDVRALRDAVKLAPAGASFKVYIIDEAHMLTLEASNALLKTLEEPPDHVVFILATTNPEKLIGTIRSRTTNIIFKKATNEEVVRSLRRVVKGEKIKIKDDSLKLIADSADGSFRDAQKILQDLVQQKVPLGSTSIEKYLNQNASTYTSKLFECLSRRDTKKALKQISSATENGMSMQVLLRQIQEELRSALLSSIGMSGTEIKGFGKDDVLTLIALFGDASKELATSYIEQLPVEIAVIKWCETVDKESQKDKLSDGIDNTKEPEVVEKVRKLERGSVDVSGLKDISEDAWVSILSKVCSINKSTEALLRATKPLGMDNKFFNLGVYYTFHKERLEEHAHRSLLEDVIAKVLGSPIRLRCTLTSPPKKSKVNSNHISRKDSNGNVFEKSSLTKSSEDDIIKIAEDVFGTS